MNMTMQGKCDNCGSDSVYRRIIADEMSAFRCSCRCH